MQIERKLSLGELFNGGAYILSALGACVFAYFFLLGDIERVKQSAVINAEAIEEEKVERIRAVERLAHRLEVNLNDIKEDMEAEELRTRYLLDELHDDLKIVVTDRLQKNGK